MTAASYYLRLLTKGPAVALESTAERRGPTGEILRDAAAGVPPQRELIERLKSEIRYAAKKTGETVEQAEVDELISNANNALEKLLGDGPTAKLGPRDINGLEAVVKTDGSRPVLFVEDDFIDVTAPSIGIYAATFSRYEDAVRRVCRSAGRVDDPNEKTLGYQGTCFALGEDLVITNFHVLQAIAPGCTRKGATFEGILNPGVYVDFAREVGRPRKDRQYPIKRVVRVGREGDPAGENEWKLNFTSLDLAVLQLEKVHGQPFPLPAPIARADDPTTRGGLATKGRAIYLVGYPGNEHSTTPDLFSKIFAKTKSYKRAAPGLIMSEPGTLDKDPDGWVLTHDASTLGGNSGSSVVDLDADGETILGLHFAGYHERQNWAHAFERITDEVKDLLPKPTWGAVTNV